MKSQITKLIWLIMAPALLLALVFSFVVPSVGVQPTARAYPEPGAEVKLPGPGKITYTNDTDVFADFPDLVDRPSGVDYDQGKLLVTIKVFFSRPGIGETELAGAVTDVGLLPGESQPDPYERLTLQWKPYVGRDRSGQPIVGDRMLEGKYRVVVAWSATGAVIDTWNFEFAERFEVLDGGTSVGVFDSLAEARSFANREAASRKKNLVIRSTRTGQVVETVIWEPGLEAVQTTVSEPLGVWFDDVQGPAKVLDRDLTAAAEDAAGIINLAMNTYLVTGSGGGVILSSNEAGKLGTLKVGENTTLLYTNQPLYKPPPGTSTTGYQVQLQYPSLTSEGGIGWNSLRFFLPQYQESLVQSATATPRFILIRGKLQIGKIYFADFNINMAYKDKVCSRLTGLLLKEKCMNMDLEEVMKAIRDAKSEGKTVLVELDSWGATIWTPLAVIKETGTSYEVTAGEDGVTEASVQEGSISVTDLRNGEAQNVVAGSRVQLTAGDGATSLPSLPVWVWFVISTGAAVIVALLAVIVALFMKRRKPKAA